MKYIIAVILGLFVNGYVQAEVKKQATSINAGWQEEISDASEESNKYSKSIVSIVHKTIADWGSVAVTTLYENMGATSNTLEGEEGNVGLKVIGTAYYNLAQSGFKAWYSLAVVSNKAVAENHNYFGAAYGHQFGKLNTTVGLALDYFSGHNRNGSSEGIIATLARLNLALPINNKLTTFGVINYHFDRDTDELASSFRAWEETGSATKLGLKYKLTPKWLLGISYAHFDNWGGYTQGGDHILTTIGYQF